MSTLIETITKDRVLTLRLNRPDKRNALNADLVTALKVALRLSGRLRRSVRTRSSVIVSMRVDMGKWCSTKADYERNRGQYSGGMSTARPAYCVVRIA